MNNHVVFQKGKEILILLACSLLFMNSIVFADNPRYQLIDEKTSEFKTKARDARINIVKQNLYNVLLGCMINWADNGGETPCTLKRVIKKSIGVILARDVLIKVHPKKNTQNALVIWGGHKKLEGTWILEASNGGNKYTIRKEK